MAAARALSLPHVISVHRVTNSDGPLGALPRSRDSLPPKCSPPLAAPPSSSGSLPRSSLRLLHLPLVYSLCHQRLSFLARLMRAPFRRSPGTRTVRAAPARLVRLLLAPCFSSSNRSVAGLLWRRWSRSA